MSTDSRLLSSAIGKFEAKEFEKLLIDEFIPVIDKQFLTWRRCLYKMAQSLFK